MKGSYTCPEGEEIRITDFTREFLTEEPGVYAVDEIVKLEKKNRFLSPC